MNVLKYNPRRRGFPFKTLKFLYEAGESPEWLIREEIGLEDWVANKGLIYYERSNTIFSNLVRELKNKELIAEDDGNYRLTEEGKKFMKIKLKK